MKQEELEKLNPQDHRVLGKKLGLFTFSDTVGKGLPLWTHKGTILRREIERFIIDEEEKWGYQHVNTPDIAKLDLYRKSGHYPYFKDSMYAPITIDDEEFMLRPMTCPHHFELFASQPRSYKDLPLRFAEIGKLYRYELSGTLTGLIRVRSFCLSDAHIFCADNDQAKSEVKLALDLIEHMASIFGLKIGQDYWYRLSLGDPKNTKKYYHNPQAWKDSEEILRQVLTERGSKFVESPDEAAFYGPKIDIQMKNITGKEDTAFTVQYDFAMPGNFKLTYTNKSGQDIQPIVIHRSSLGAIERIIAFLIEHYKGNFPVWLAPVQAAVLPISQDQNDYAQKLTQKLTQNGIRTQLDINNDSLGKKIRNATTQKIPYLLIIGEKEQKTNAVSVRTRTGEDLGVMSTTQFLSLAKQKIDNKALDLVK